MTTVNEGTGHKAGPFVSTARGAFSTLLGCLTRYGSSSVIEAIVVSGDS